MYQMFLAAGQFNADISRWDVSSVTDMNQMFRDANTFNADISRWDVSSVTDMVYMFNGASQFNADISPGRWHVSSVTNMHRMFQFAFAFNADITRWDTSSVTNMGSMFYSAAAWQSRFHNCGFDSSHQACGEVAFYTPSTDADRRSTRRVGSQRRRVRCVHPTLNGDVGNCTDTLVSGTSCVPECHPGYVLQGVTSCTDRVLTQEATCA